MDKITQLANIIKDSKYLVFFGGAGVSTESDIPDFRSSTGLYNVKMKVPSLKNTNYRAEDILSHSFFMNHNKLFFDYYFNAMLYPSAKPNYAHEFLTLLEKDNKLKAIITQNIDGLHQLSGSKNVLELHGSVKRNYCMQCHYFMDDVDLVNHHAVCPKCQGIMKPDVVLYEEALDEEVIKETVKNIMRADCLIIGGTSLNVYPAASFVQYFTGKYLVIINMEKTAYDEYATLCINDKIGETFKKVNAILNLK